MEQKAVVKYRNISRIAAFTLLIILVFIIAMNLIPIKKTLNMSGVKSSTGLKTIICENTQTSGPQWELLGDENSFFSKDKTELIDIKWNVSGAKPNSSIFIGQNKFVFYGKFTGYKKEGNESFKVFEISKWDILYPIDRFSLRSYFSPKSYLNIFDYIQFEN